MKQVAEDLLLTVPLYQRLPLEDRVRLAEVTTKRDYPKGAVIFSEGDSAEVFFTIARGRVKVFKATPAGKEVILEIFGPGDPLGAIAVYEGRSYPASSIALEPTTCLLVQKQDFFRLLEAHPTLVRSLLLAMTRRLVELTNRLAELTSGRIEPRIARLFLKLGNELGIPAPQGAIRIPMALSRQELADLTGTTIETCIRIMSRWNKEEIVITDKHGFTLVDREALRTLAQA
jgi:CRP/FNR family transcriptional regulator